MKQLVSISIIVLLCTAFFAPMLHAGKLDRVRKATRKSSPVKRDKPSRDKEDDDHHDRDDHSGRGHSDGGGGWLSLAVDLCNSRSDSCPSACSSSSSRPIAIVQECPADCPIISGYDQGYNDSFVETIAPPQLASSSLREQMDAWSHRIALNGGTDFDGLDQTQFAWLVQQPGGLGLDMSATMFREDEVDYHDSLWLGDANLMFEPVLGELRARLGIGMNWMNDQAGFESGLNLTGGFDMDIAGLLVVSGEVDRGSLGNADFSHSQITVGLQTEGVEWFTGYSRHNIGGVKLDGMIYGIRLRF